MRNPGRGHRKPVAVITTACLTLAVGETLAQQESEDQRELEEVLVTGTFISRPADRPQPVSVISNEEIEANQRVTLAEVVRDMPQVASANTTSNSLNPSNSIDLRGLGERSTLVLLNGQRQTIDANDNSVVDINNLAPSLMVERVELVLDGASALYGSDAVAGVANFITRDSFEGLEFQVGSQFSEAQTDVPEVNAGMIFGHQGDQTGLVTSVEWQQRSDVMEASDIRSLERLEEGLVTGFYNPGTFLSSADGAFHADPLCGSPEIGGMAENRLGDPAGYLPGDGFCRGLLTLRRTLIPETETLKGMAVVTHDFDTEQQTRLRFEMSMAKAEMRRHEGTGLPFLGLSEVNAFMPADNPGIIDANQRDPSFPVADVTSIFSRQKSPVEGPVVMRTEQWTYRTALGLDGVFGDGSWDWSFDTTYSTNDQFSQDVDTIASRFTAAVAGFGGPGCKWNPVLGTEDDPNGLEAGVGPCQWYNPFASRLIAEPGDPTYNDPDLVDWMQWGESPIAESRLYTAEGVVTGELWEMAGGQAGIAFGAQYRRQALEYNADPIQKDGDFGFAPQVVTDWSSDRDTNAFFTELVLYPSETLEVDVAARYEETLGKSSVDPKISMLWRPSDSLYFRASAGTSFRLASEFQSFGVGEGAGSVYPLGGEVTQARGLQVGNPDLEPEESENWTLGFTWDATDNTSIEATWWHYDFTNLVTSTDATDILLADIADGFIDNTEAHPLFPGRPNEVCEITGRWAGPDSGEPLPEGCVTGFDIRIFNNSWINQNRVETAGLDFSVDWRTGLSGGGDLGFRFLSTFVDNYKGIDVNGDLVDVVGTDGFGVAGIEDNPEYRANFIGTYSIGDHSVRATLRHTAGTEITNPDPNVQNSSEASYSQLDLVYSLMLPTQNASSLTVSILNAADREPPLVANGLLTSNSALFDPRGRMLRLTFDYGF